MSIVKKCKLCNYDVNLESVCRVSSMYKYFQQAAREDLDALGLPYEKLLGRGMVFVLVKMQTRFYEPLFTDDEFEIETCHRKVKGASFIRDYLVTQNGKTIAQASSYWVLIDFNTRKICRPTVLGDELGEPRELIPFEIDTKLTFPENISADEYAYRVVYSDIDENKHMNNTRYPDICMDAIGNELKNVYASEVRIDYINEAKLGEALILDFVRDSDNNAYYFKAINIDTGEKCFDAVLKFNILGGLHE